MKKIKKAIAFLLAVLMLSATVGCGTEKETQQAVSDESGRTVEEMLGLDQPEPEVYYNGKTYVENPDVSAYLFMGVDKSGELDANEASYRQGGQADVQLVLVVDESKEVYRILQLNRDTMTNVQVLSYSGTPMEKVEQQIALAYAYGDGGESSCENAVLAVSDFLYGIEIEGFASLLLDAIPVLNDWAGGVTVTIEDDFSQVDPSLVMGETITLSGEQAYNYIRGRTNVGDETNLNRMARHREYLSGLASQLEAKVTQDVSQINELYKELQPYMVTNLSSGAMIKLADKCRNYTNGGVLTIEGEAVLGEQFMEFYPDENSVKDTVMELFYMEKPVQEESK